MNIALLLHGYSSNELPFQRIEKLDSFVFAVCTSYIGGRGTQTSRESVPDCVCERRWDCVACVRAAAALPRQGPHAQHHRRAAANRRRPRWLVPRCAAMVRWIVEPRDERVIDVPYVHMK